jgi:glycyl-tRNA synthetase (class II)
MKTIFSNATVMWSEEEIELREALIREIPSILKRTWTELNPAVKMERIETPILTPGSYLEGHIKTGFELINAGERGFLRPETTAGTFEAFALKFPQAGQLKKQLPYCLWQVGKSFRDETNPETMRASKLRLVEFYQMEFQLFVSEGTKADYVSAALNSLVKRFGGSAIGADELPHYSRITTDWMMSGLEVAGCSIRTDWPYGEVHEVAIGLDRLVAKILSGE